MAKKKPKLSPWQEPPAHPVLEKLPMQDAAQIIETANDIEANGLHIPISIWVDDSDDPGGEGPFPQTLLDGRSRIAALKHLGITDPRNAPYSSSEGKRAVRYLRASEHPGINPATLVISLNLHRLHLGGERRRELIKVLIQMYPQTSNRGIAKMAGASHTTVAGVRESENSQEAEMVFQMAKLAKWNTCRMNGQMQPFKRIPTRA